MIFSILLAALAQSSAAAPVEVTDFPAIFAAACMDGEARLSPNDASRIGFDALPAELKSSLGEPESANVWRLNGNGRGYLYVLNYPVGRGTSPKICGVASDVMNFEAGVRMLDKRLAGNMLRNPSRTMQWLRPRDGYVATATTAAKFGVLQINWLSEADRHRLIAETSSLPK